MPPSTRFRTGTLSYGSPPPFCLRNPAPRTSSTVFALENPPCESACHRCRRIYPRFKRPDVPIKLAMKFLTLARCTLTFEDAHVYAQIGRKTSPRVR